MTMQGLIERAGGRAGLALVWVKAIPRRLENLSRSARLLKAESVIIRPQVSIRERQEELGRFYEKHESLVELLCDSAQYGPDSHIEGKYHELRTWMQRNYKTVKPLVVAYLDFEVDDTAGPLERYGQPADAFEALYAAPTLNEQLRADDGNMISRIIRTREALNRYAEQLRRTAA